jgi:5-methylcytosine-specific restriction endonuclease McrA
MPYMTNGKRDYKKQQAYDGKPTVVKDRAKRNGARRKLMEEGKDVDHKKPLSKGGGNKRSNLRVTSKTANRSFSRTKTGKMK